MIDCLKFSGYECKRMARQLQWKLKGRSVPRQYAGRLILGIEDGNCALADMVTGNVPFMVARYGYNELKLFMDAVVRGSIQEKSLERMCAFAGFFPKTKEAGMRYGDVMAKASACLDMAALYYCPGEEYALSRYCPQATLVINRAIEPWYSAAEPWSWHLGGKKVLVIHPFEGDIQAQYRRHEELFPGKDILPSFELKTVKAVQSIGGKPDGRYMSWFEALDDMTERASRTDFDIALIGCGAYGLPLAANIKNMGKQAIHLGGALQLLFGIKGARWDQHPVISKFYNDSWIRPSDQYKPESAQKVEGGCYW